MCHRLLGVGGLFTVVNDLAGGDGASNAAFWGNCWNVNNWVDIGFSLPGTSGPPLLVGNGSLAYGSINTVNLSNAMPSATAGLFMGFTFGPTAFAGGTLVPAGVALHLQWVSADPGAVAGLALSNCVVGTTP